MNSCFLPLLKENTLPYSKHLHLMTKLATLPFCAVRHHSLGPVSCCTECMVSKTEAGCAGGGPVYTAILSKFGEIVKNHFKFLEGSVGRLWRIL